jgi:hypothetical protein
VFLELSGSRATSGRRVLLPQPPRASAFARGAVDAFPLDCAQHLGDLEAAVVGHDGRGPHPAWHLEQVRGN